MFVPGDVIEMFAPQAGYEKYFLCVCGSNANGVLRFFYINSGDGYEGDFSYNDTELPYLPASPTGKSVISTSYLLIYSEKELKLYRARRLGTLSTDIVSVLVSELPKVRKLPPQDRKLAVSGLAAAIPTDASASDPSKP